MYMTRYSLIHKSNSPESGAECLPVLKGGDDAWMYVLEVVVTSYGKSFGGVEIFAPSWTPSPPSIPAPHADDITESYGKVLGDN